jgi:CBS domain containing-hemolysin-like protein
MSAALLAAILATSGLLALVTYVQVLYLESLRLRARDLPSIRHFRDELEGRIGLRPEQGAAAFSLVKHTLFVAITVLFCAWFGHGAASRQSLAQTAGAAWLTMMVAGYGVPQLLYRRGSGRWAVRLTPLLKLVALAAAPLVGVLNFFQSLVELADENGGTEDAEPTAADNIETLITAGEEEGLIQEDDRKLIQSVVEFGDKVVREVMTPRPNIVAVEANAPLEELRDLVINEQYSRIPVYDGDIDHAIGFVHVRDMFELDEEERAHRTVRELLRPIPFVPETKPVNDLMREMQQESTHMVIVVDEYGNTAGLATMEDLVEVILGEIRDEHEPASDVVEDGQGGYIVSGNFDLARLAKLLEFRPEDEIESTTVGGLVSEWLGRVPQPGEFVERNSIRIDVLASDERRVEQVRIARSQAVPHE